jgi:hypothetical protein
MHKNGDLNNMHFKAFPTLYQAFLLNLPLSDNLEVTKLKGVLLTYILKELNDNTRDAEILNLLRLLQVEGHDKLLNQD